MNKASLRRVVIVLGGNHAAIFQRASTSSSALAYLTRMGYSPEVSAGMIKACGTAPSERELEKFGNKGLAQLAQSVQRELDEAAALSGRARLSIEVSAPASNRSFTVEVQEGQNLYEVAQSGPLGDYLECVCKGIAACSTCHVILDEQQTQAQSFGPPDEAELDMLDLAADRTSTSRLGCQLKLGPMHNGLRISIPRTFNNLY